MTEVVSLYESWINRNPGHPLKYVAVYNLATTLTELNRDQEALPLFEQVVLLKPSFTECRINLGGVLEKVGRNEAAITEWLKVANNSAPEGQSPDQRRATVSIDTPDNFHFQTTALNSIGRLYEKCREYDLAEEHLRTSLEINPCQPSALQHLIMLRRKQCKWPVYTNSSRITECEMLLGTSPIAMLAESDDPLYQLLSAVSFFSRKVKPATFELWKGETYGHKRLRIGYLSFDFKVHAVGLLLPEVFECHDRSKVETYGFCISHNDGSELRKRIIKSLEHFEEVSHLSDEQIAEHIHKCEIDVLIDLSGYSQGARPEIFGFRPAPVHVAWLGYIGTSGMPHMDYIVADKTSLPPELCAYVKEKPLYLPHSFLPKDWQRSTPEPESRLTLGLPPDKFIFASFNNIYKLNERMFSVWMNILKNLPESVLWLLDDNEWATANLRAFAAGKGIAPDRLIFASRVTHNKHRARLPAADLFLDNHPYNAGSTAVDVLAMGLPMLTLAGKSFVSRMGASLLSDIGLNELITESYEAYEKKAVGLASNPDDLKVLREKINEFNRTQSHSSQNFARNLETLFFSCTNARHGSNMGSLAAPYPTQPDAATHSTHQDGVRSEGASKTVLLRSWRGINHPNALFTQYQLRELLKDSGLDILHEDLPYTSTTWSPTLNPAGFEAVETLKLTGIQSYDGREVDLAISTAYPYSLFKGPAKKVLTFMAPEMALTASHFTPDSPSPATFTEGRNWVMTPSEWGKRILVAAGLDPDRVAVIGPGVDTRIFTPLSSEVRSEVRVQLKIAPDEFAFLYHGGAFWAEGSDIVLRAFQQVFKQNPKVRLIVKDNRSLWGRSIDSTISDLRRTNPNAISMAAMRHIVTLPGEVSLTQLGRIYSAADMLVNPYRASSLNLSILESIASGTRVLATEGGPSDACQFGGALFPIRSFLSNPKLTGASPEGPYLEPDLKDLIQKMLSASRQPAFRHPLPPLEEDPTRLAFLKARTWEASSKRVLDMLVD